MSSPLAPWRFATAAHTRRCLFGGMFVQRGQLIGGPQARVPLYVPYADFFQYQAGAGRLAVRA